MQQQHRRDGVALEEGSSFGRLVWTRYVETAEEDESERVIHYAPLAVGAGELEVTRVNVKLPGVFVDILKYRQRLQEVELY